MGRLRYVLVNPENPRSLATRTRARRWLKFADVFPDLGAANVLDLGGAPRYWRQAPLRPAHVTTVNLKPAQCPESWITHVVADACQVDDLGSYDIVFSNSLIEHVGGHERRIRLAELITNSGPRFWVQTPYRYFPIEPHFLVPAMQFMPVTVRAAIATRWQVGPRHRSYEDALHVVQRIELIGMRQLRSYFPEGRIEIEWFAGLPKSITAVRG